MVIEDYISFETAKLLKKKGFSSDNCHTAYDKNGGFFWYGDYSKDRRDVIDAPTLQMAMKWLREVHNIHIKAVRYPAKVKNSNNEYCKLWWPEITMLKSLDEADEEFDLWDEYNTYEKACEAAIKYCLENLI